MDRLVENLIQLLQQCEELYARMLPMIALEKQAVLGSDPEQLTKITVKKEDLIAQLKLLDRERARLLQEIADALQMSFEDLTLTTLAETIAPPHGHQLKLLGDTLKHTLAEVQKTNDESRRLVAHSLMLVRNTMNFFSRWTGSPTVYGASGNIDRSPMRYARMLSSTA